LTDAFAYKLKKPVKYDFLDFSTVELRHQACLEEVRLNRRLAPDVYLGVLPIIRALSGNLQLRGDGETIDWLVKMRRLSDDDTLLAAIEKHRVSDADLDAVASTLADFYRAQPPIHIDGEQYRTEIDRHVRGNLNELLLSEVLFPAHEVRRIHSAQLTYLALQSQVFDQRVKQGRIVDGHGDLRPEHIYLTSPPCMIDCIEFNAEFRRLDVLDELAFLETECVMVGAVEIGQRLASTCLTNLNDQAPESLSAFFKSYRACVRGKVAVLRARQLTGPSSKSKLSLARRYLDLADRYDELLGPPWLLVVCGASGTGKSTVAQAIAERLQMEVLRTDVVRREMIAAKNLSSSPKDRYSAANRRSVYEEMYGRANELLASRTSVILDGTFLSRSSRAEALEIAERHGAHSLIVHCECPREVARARIAERTRQQVDPSEAPPEIVESQLEASEPDLPNWPSLRLDTTQSVDLLVHKIVARMAAIPSST
jgi:aminoglycoside phosphotransferase family enzyme/predicted kinase